MSTELIKAEAYGIDKTAAKELVDGLTTTLAERDILKKAYLELLKLEVTKDNLTVFKDLRLKILRNRTQGIEVWRENKKRFFLTGGNFVDATAKMYKDENSIWESKLMDAEKTFENIEKALLLELQTARANLISPYLGDADERDYTKLDEYEFEAILALKIRKFNEAEEARKIEEQEAEAKRLAEEKKLLDLKVAADKLKKEVEKREALRKTRNEELRPYISFVVDYNELLDSSEKDYKIFFKLAKERVALAAELEAEENKVKLEADKKALQEKVVQDAAIQAQKVKTEALAKIVKDREDADKKVEGDRKAKEEADKKLADILAKAPIREQLTAWVNEFSIATLSPELKNNEVALVVSEKFEAFKKWSLTQINNI
jgi:hypothetical protein